MPGRNAKPIQMHIYEGNTAHLTKEEIEQRLKNEIHFGDHNFKASRRLKGNRVAFKKWKELIGLYKIGNIQFVTTSDAALLERYCITHSEYENLLKVKDDIESRGWDTVKTYHAIDELGLENNINKKLDVLLKMEDRLFLNPLSKIKNVTRNPSSAKEQDPLQQAGFGNV